MEPSKDLLVVRSRLKGVKGNNFKTIVKLKHENLSNQPGLKWDEGEIA